MAVRFCRAVIPDRLGKIDRARIAYCAQRQAAQVTEERAIGSGPSNFNDQGAGPGIEHSA